MIRWPRHFLNLTMTDRIAHKREKKGAVRFAWTVWVFSLIWTFSAPGAVFSAADRETITWFKIDFPPIYIISGENKGQGVADKALETIIAGLPDYKHIVQVATVSRLTEELKRGTNVCTATLFITEERRQFGYFANYPTTFLPPIAVITRKDDPLLHSNPKMVSLEMLLTDRSHMLGVVADRSYGDDVDRVLATHNGQRNLFFRSGEGATEGLLEMVLKNRIDYTITYPWILTARLGEVTANSFGALPFEEAGSYAQHYPICSKTAWGREVIRRVDAVLGAALPTPKYRANIERWLPEDLRPTFRGAYERFVSGEAQ